MAKGTTFKKNKWRIWNFLQGESEDQKENLWGSTTSYNSTACRLKTSMIPARTRMCTNFSRPAKNLSFHNHSWNSFFKIHKLKVMCTIHLNMWNLNTISTFYTSTRLICQMLKPVAWHIACFHIICGKKQCFPIACSQYWKSISFWFNVLIICWLCYYVYLTSSCR